MIMVMMKIPKLKNRVVKNILFALAVAIFGFILLNITFILDFLYQSLVDWVVKLFTPIDINMVWHWYAPLKHIVFVIIIGLISWYIFRSKLGMLYKAIFMTVPLAVVFVTIGMFLYPWPWVVYLVGFFI